MSCDNFNKGKCSTCDNRKIISVSENRSSYKKYNLDGKMVCLVRIDGCLIDQGQKCDFLLIECDNQKAYFIELKGVDLLHAVDQISSSIDVIKNKLSGFEINARIVLTKVRVPNLRNNPKILKLERKLKSLNAGKLAYGSIKMVE